MFGSGASGKLSVLVSLVAGVILVLVIFLKDRPDERKIAKPVRPPTPHELPQPEPAAEAVLAAISLPPPPVLPKPQPEATLKPLQTKEAVVEPPKTVKPMEPTAKPERIETKPMVVKPLEKKVEAPPKPKELKPRKPMKAVKAAQKAPVVKPRKSEPVPIKAKPRIAEPKPEPVQSETVHVSVRSGGQVAKEGRALLRLLEHGSGPTIEIAWPTGSSNRRNLYRTLSGCFGMQAILMDGSGNLFAAKGQKGQKWEINLDRYSGFVRQPAGFIAPQERTSADAIRRYHGFGWDRSVVRVFPRQVDSVLLGGLQQVLGENYSRTKVIRATYRQVGGALYIEGIEADGMKVDGRIAFNPKRGSGCRI
ncbi:MAG: hypothetical protein ISR44_06980 [Rhodospirillales bacterium]|nr:hypothetical protein [Rhodospirillales bacterium]